MNKGLRVDEVFAIVSFGVEVDVGAADVVVTTGSFDGWFELTSVVVEAVFSLAPKPNLNPPDVVVVAPLVAPNPNETKISKYY